MKKLISALISAVLMTVLFSCGTNADFTSATYYYKPKSSSCFVYRLNTDEIRYFNGDADEKIYPASTTKLLTSLAALEIMPPDELIQPGDEVYLPPEGSSSAYIRPNHTLTLEMLIEGMLIPSGNDAAYAAAAGCGYILLDGNEADCTAAVTKFVEYMNEYAESIGCTGTSFTTPDGYAGDEHFSTLHDMAVISKLAAENGIILKYAGMYSDDVTYASGHTNTWVNTNRLLDKDSGFYCENVVGLKTGSLANNYSLIALYDDGEASFIVGVFGAKNDDDRYTDARNLINLEKYVYGQ